MSVTKMEEQDESEQDEEPYVKVILWNKKGAAVDYTIIDRDVYEKMTFTPSLNKDGYCQIKVKGKTILLHRYIMKAKKGDPKVDHINGNKLDNRRENLRFVTDSQNAQNRLKPEGTSSEYIGVYKRTYDYGIRWIARIKFNGNVTERTFKDEKHAAYWYDAQAINLYSTDKFKPKTNGLEKPDDYTEPEVKKYDPLSGVTKTRNGTFQVKIQYKKKRIHIGTFNSKEKAKEAYNKKKKELQTINLQEKVGNEIQRNDDGIAIIVTKKEEEILVDDDKYFELKKYTWSINEDGYVHASMNGKPIAMHRYLLNAPNGIMVDHRNHVRHDNRMTNIRLVSDTLNSHNVSKRKNTSSKYIGVYKKDSKFAAEIRKDFELYHLGTFVTELDATIARDLKAIELFGDDANLNLLREELEGESIEDLIKQLEIPVKTKRTIRNHRKPKKENATSKYVGVSKKRDKFAAEITKDGIKYKLGTFNTQREAAKARDAKAIELYGDNAYLERCGF